MGTAHQDAHVHSMGMGLLGYFSCYKIFQFVICHENVAYSCVSVCSDRWVHAVCESLYTEDEVEQASDEGFACTYCAPYVPKPVGKCDNKADTKFFNAKS